MLHTLDKLDITNVKSGSYDKLCLFYCRFGHTNAFIGYSSQKLHVEKIKVHEDYQYGFGYKHDIALLKLKPSAILGENVGLVNLPDKNVALVPGKECFITGWGAISSGGIMQNYLQEAAVPIVSEKKCKEAYGSVIHDSMICAGFDKGGVDACQGDSGGPLVCKFNGKWYLEGITSWGHGCARPNYYGVYANVRYLQEWVEKTMKDN